MALANWLVPKRAKVVVHGFPDHEDGTLAVIDALIARGRRPTVLLNTRRGLEEYRARYSNKVVVRQKRSVHALYHFLTASHVIVTHGVYGNRRVPRGQTVVNLWHGEPAGKPVGTYDGYPTLRCTAAPVLSTLGQAYRCAEFGLRPKHVPVHGAPRNDRLVGAEQQTVRKRVLGDANCRTLFLWLPTYRAAEAGENPRHDVETLHRGLPFDADSVKRLDQWLVEQRSIVLVKPHPYEARPLDGSFDAIRVLGHGDLVAASCTLYELLAAADCLITDISSVWVDFLLVDRPIIAAFPDISEYRRRRGINLEPYEDWMPAPFAGSIDELLGQMQRVTDGEDVNRALRERAQRIFHRFNDGQSAARLLDHVGIR